ncbi:MAG: hypothetical protein HW411_1142 [Gammaproteobacteria bacterium]|nr:hypothetical protein [Gammaproteobacteria bacterium]
MSPTNIKVIFLAAIVFVLWGGYKIAKVSYTAIVWQKTEGTIVDLERNTWSCGKGVSKCFSPIAGYHANNDYFTVVSEKKFNRDEPKHLIGNKVVIYYSSANPAEAVLGGEYGPMSGGIIMFLLGTAILIGFWFAKIKEAAH